jgi:hypothetical protein
VAATPPTAEAQALLARAARAGVHRLAIPTPFAVGRVNCWLIEDEPLTLLDAGPNSGKALDALERALGDHGRRVEDLQRIVISHQHMDHEGLVEILARRSGAEVCAIAPLAPWLARFGEEMEADDVFGEQMMLHHGLPREVARPPRSPASCTTAGRWASPRAPCACGIAPATPPPTRCCTTRRPACCWPPTTSSTTSPPTRC